MKYKSVNQLSQQITEIIQTAFDFQTTLPMIARVIGDCLEVDACLIITGVQNPSPWEQSAWFKDGLTMTHQLIETPSEDSLLSIMLKSSLPLLISDIHNLSSLKNTGWIDPTNPLKAILGVPTRLGAIKNGLVIIGRVSKYQWSKWEQEALQIAADRVSLAIAQLELAKEKFFAQQYLLLGDLLTKTIGTACESESILSVAIAQITQILNIKRGLALLLRYADPIHKHQNNEIPKAQIRVVFQSDEVETFSFALTECQWCQNAYETAPESLHISNLLHPNQPPTSKLVAQDCQSLLIVPLLGKLTLNSHKVLGFLMFQNDQPHNWRSYEIKLVEWAASQVSTAIIHNQTLRQVQLLVEERTQQLQSSLEVQAKLYEKTKQQVEELRKLNVLKDEFLSTVSHELKTPLTKMIIAIEMLRQPDRPAEKRAIYLNILEQQCHQELNLINDLLKLQKLESAPPPLHLQKIDINELIQNLSFRFELEWSDKGLILELNLPDHPCGLQSDVDSLTKILEELLTNAGKYSDNNSTIKIEIKPNLSKSSNQIIFTLTNIGRGILPNELDYIFDKFRRGQGVTEEVVPGTGLGLALVKHLVEHLNGNISVTSNPIKDSSSWETCVTLIVPQVLDGSIS